MDRALSDDWRKQYAFASYFSHLTGDTKAQERWKAYATFIVTTITDTSKLEEEYNELNAKIIATRKENPLDPQLKTLEAQRSALRARLEINQAVLQPDTSMTSRLQATKQHVFDRGTPPDSFLDELIA